MVFSDHKVRHQGREGKGREGLIEKKGEYACHRHQDIVGLLEKRENFRVTVIIRDFLVPGHVK